MIFRPRIFISSTLGENLSVRSEIEKFFKSVGAEPMLYESNLTPSVIPASYRRDILDADFVLFIIKNKYGTPTLDTGLSGLHEEFRIALTTDLPKHIYIKKDCQEAENPMLKTEIDHYQLSYYYFENDNELLARIKETTFTIAKEIMLRKVENLTLPPQSAKKIAANYDYTQAVSIIQIVRTMQEFNQKYCFDYVTTTLFNTFIGPIAIKQGMENGIFIDKLLESKLENLLQIHSQFEQAHGLDYATIPSTGQQYTVPILGEILIHSCQVSAYPNISFEGYCSFVNQFLFTFDDFRIYVQNMKINTDTDPTLE